MLAAIQMLQLLYVHMLCFTSSNPCCCCGNHLFAASFFLQVIVHVVHLAVLMIQQCFLKFIVHGTLRGVLTRKTSQYATIITCRADPGVGCRGCISQKNVLFYSLAFCYTRRFKRIHFNKMLRNFAAFAVANIWG